MGIKFGITLALCVLYAAGESTLQDVHLLGLTTETSGTASIAVAGQNRSFVTNYPFTTSSVRVSPACSANGRSSRCQKLPIISRGQVHIVVAPLQDAVGLMELEYDGRELLSVGDFTLSITDEFFTIDNCIPLDIFYYDSSPVVVCLENMLILRSCNINIDEAAISQSTLSDCVDLRTFTSPAEYRYISNFVSSGDQVLFAANGIIYGIRFDRYDVQLYSSLNDISCNHLEYAGNHILYAYCALGRTLVYNTDTLQMENTFNRGQFIPFSCPQSEQTLFQVQQTDQGTVVRYNNRMNYRTTGSNFTIGECYDADTFLLVDNIEGTMAFLNRQRSGSFHPISNSSRDRNLVVFDGPYLVVHRTNPPEAVLYNPTFQSIVSLHGAAMATGILTDLRKQPNPTTVPTTMSSQTTPPSDSPPVKESSLSAGAWVGIVLGIAVVVVLLVFILIGVPVIFCYRRRLTVNQCMNMQNRDDLTEGDLESQHQSTSDSHSSNSQCEPTLKSHSLESRTPESHSSPRNRHTSESQQHEPTTEPHSSENQRMPTLELYCPDSQPEPPRDLHTSPMPSPTTLSPAHSFEETTTPHCASPEGQAQSGLVSASYSSVPVTQLTAQAVLDKYNERTNTDDKRNDEHRKRQFLHNS